MVPGPPGRSLDLLDVEQMARALADLHRLIPVPTLVVHSMYWAIAYGHNSPALAAALKGGVTMATTRFCCGDDFGVEAYRTIEPAPASPLEPTLPQRFTGGLAHRSAVCRSLL
jgi:ADP-dependent phosphofructokinase/glucokinase